MSDPFYHPPNGFMRNPPADAPKPMSNPKLEEMAREVSERIYDDSLDRRLRRSDHIRHSALLILQVLEQAHREGAAEAQAELVRLQTYLELAGNVQLAYREAWDKWEKRAVAYEAKLAEVQRLLDIGPWEAWRHAEARVKKLEAETAAPTSEVLHLPSYLAGYDVEKWLPRGTRVKFDLEFLPACGRKEPE